MRTTGVSANIESHYKSIQVPVGDSIITLLWKLHCKLTGGGSGDKSVYIPPGMGSRAAAGGVGEQHLAPKPGTSQPGTSAASHSAIGQAAAANVNQSSSDKPNSCDTKTDNKTADNRKETVSGGTGDSSAESRIGGGAYFVAKVLDKLCERSEENQSVIRKLYEQTVADQSKGQKKGKANTAEER